MECNPMCVYFPATQKIVREEVVDGVKHRTVIRRCGYSGNIITSWDDCYREGGALLTGDAHD